MHTQHPSTYLATKVRCAHPLDDAALELCIDFDEDFFKRVHHLPGLLVDPSQNCWRRDCELET